MTLNNVAAKSRNQGFTLIELLVVVGMIAVILGAITTSFSSARERARIQKATAEVKVISQAILAYENWARGGKYELKTMGEDGDGVDADKESLSFLLGKEAAESGGTIPVMLMARLQGGGALVDPWGTPYKIQVKDGKISTGAGLSVRTGYFLPNFYRNNE